jgi:hypothetical protein
VINAKESWPDLRSLAGDQDISTFDYQAKTTLIADKIFNHIIFVF